MRKAHFLSRCFFSGARGQMPANRFTVKSFTETPRNVNDVPMVLSFSRKFTISSISKLSSSFGACQSKGDTVEKENATDKNLVIYIGALTSQIKGVKIFTCTSSIGGLIIQPILLQNLMSGTDIPLTLALGTTVGFFTFVTPFLIHLLTRKYVIEMRYNPATEVYTATTLSFFLRRINVEFKLKDVTLPADQPFFTTLLIKGKPVFMTSDSFLNVNHYIQLMGYDKPMDLKLNVPFEKLEENQLGKGKNVA